MRRLILRYSGSVLLRMAGLIVFAILATGCQSKSNPPSPSPSPGGGDTITGRERIGWDQPASSAGELGTFGYAIYVDGARSDLGGVSCDTTPGSAGFACSGQLPTLTSGAHTLELLTFVRDTPSLQSARSPALRVTVAASTTGDAAAADWPEGEAGRTSDGVPLFVERLADGLDTPVDAAFAPGGRLFVAERGGRVRIFADGRLQPAPALAADDVEGGALLAIAIDPEFTSNGNLFTLAAVPSSGGGSTFRLARYREVRGVLAQRAVLLEAPAPADASGAMRFGPDARLYIALGTAEEDDPSSYVGKVLRLNRDGTTPKDRGGASPMYSSGYTSPRALAWAARGGPLWIGDGTAIGTEWIAGLAAAAAPAAPVRWAMPTNATTSALAFYDSDRIPQFQGNLFVASSAARQIQRVRFDPDDPLRIVGVETLLEDRIGPIHEVVAGPDGAIYVCAGTSIGRLAAGDSR